MEPMENFGHSNAYKSLGSELFVSSSKRKVGISFHFQKGRGASPFPSSLHRHRHLLETCTQIVKRTEQDEKIVTRIEDEEEEGHSKNKVRIRDSWLNKKGKWSFFSGCLERETTSPTFRWKHSLLRFLESSTTGKRVFALSSPLTIRPPRAYFSLTFPVSVETVPPMVPHWNLSFHFRRDPLSTHSFKHNLSLSLQEQE